MLSELSLKSITVHTLGYFLLWIGPNYIEVANIFHSGALSYALFKKKKKIMGLVCCLQK